MILSFILIVSAAFADVTHPGVCSDLIQNGRVQKIIELVNKLNPALIESESESVTMETLYLTLKREDEAWRGKEISPEMGARIRANYAGQFDVQDATQFYRNALYNLETRVADLWRVQETRAQTGSVLSTAMESVAGHLLDTFFSPYNLNDRSLTSVAAERYFKEKPWLRFPWRDAIASVIKFRAAMPDAYYNQYARWYANENPKLDWGQQQRVTLALSRGARPGMCCLANPGCFRCPLNRRDLKGL